jgi:hypothetical protein
VTSTCCGSQSGTCAPRCRKAADGRKWIN